MARINLSNKVIPISHRVLTWLSLLFKSAGARHALPSNCENRVKRKLLSNPCWTGSNRGRNDILTRQISQLFSLSYSRSQCGNGAAILAEKLWKINHWKKSSHRAQINSQGLNFRASAKKSSKHFSSLIICMKWPGKHLEAILVKMFVENLAPENKFNKKMTFLAWARALFVFGECISPLWNVSLGYPGQKFGTNCA